MTVIPFPTPPDTHRLTYQDEELVIRWRGGETVQEIADALGYHVSKVYWALDAAAFKGVAMPPLPTGEGAMRRRPGT